MFEHSTIAATIAALRPAVAACVLLCASGCAVGPDFVSPMPQAPAQTAFSNSASQHDVFAAAPPPAAWWKLYEDPALDAIVGEALAANTDLRVAAANLARASAVLREARGGRLPSITADAGVTKSRQNFFLDEPIAVENTVYNVSVGASYQLDFFGRVRRAIEATRANAEATEAALHVAQISVVAQTAGAYAEACAYGAQLGVAENNLALQTRSLELTEQLRDAGRGTALDVSSASAAAAQSRALIPSLRAQRDAALYSLAVLMGRAPADYPAEAANCNTLVTLAQKLPVGDGAALLQRRPDLRQAERELAAATARVGIATAEFYPSVSLGGSVGSAALSANALGDSNTKVWSFGPLLSWTFPNVIGTRARVAQTEADLDAATARFDGAWLNALRETESALSAYANELERVAALREARTFSADAVNLANLRFNAGQQSFLDVLQVELTSTQAEMALAQSEARLAALQIDLFLALGGGWGNP